MLFWETDAVYCDNNMEHTDKLCGQDAVLVLKQITRNKDNWMGRACSTRGAAEIKKYLKEGNDVYAQMGCAEGPMAGSCEHSRVLYRFHNKTKLRGLSQRANYIGRATAACRRR
jgi:hypothetical protein